MIRYKNSVLSAMAVIFLFAATVQAQEPRERLRVNSWTGTASWVIQDRTARSSFTLTGAWWTNTALLQRLGLTDDQKTRIERAYENHRSRIMSASEQLEKDEAQLAKLLDTDPLDRNAALAQIDRVAQSRSEVERANSAMMLEMREHLTRAQWSQLSTQAAPYGVGTGLRAVRIQPAPGTAPAPNGGGARRGGGGFGPGQK